MTNYEMIWRHVTELPWYALLATGRTGSDAFQSQIDGHPKVFLIHGYLPFHDFWDSALSVSHPGALDSDDIAIQFCSAFIEKFRSRYDRAERKDRLGDTMDQSICVDLDAFRTHMSGLMKGHQVTSRNFLVAVYTAYAMAADQDPLTKTIFLHHVHNVPRLPRFLDDFPDAKIIATMRDPRAAYVSYVEHSGRTSVGAENIALPLLSITRIVEEPRSLCVHGDRVRAIRLEDFGDPIVVAMACDWMGLPFQPSVMKSTWHGLRWWGDSRSRVQPTLGMDEQQFVSQMRNANAWPRALSGIEKYVLEFLLGARLDWYAYPQIRRNACIHAMVVFGAILLPMTYERKLLNPLYWMKCLRARQWRQIVRIPYHYALRVRYYYRLYFRALGRQEPQLEYFGRQIETRSSGIKASLSLGNEMLHS